MHVCLCTRKRQCYSKCKHLAFLKSFGRTDTAMSTDKARIFRDVKRVTRLTVMRERPLGLRIVELEQLGEVRILLKKLRHRTLLKLTEDYRDPGNLSIHFDCIRSVSASYWQASAVMRLRLIYRNRL